MTDIKVTTYVLTVVDLQCCKCYAKVKKLLCRYKEIRDQVYDPKKNTVTIKVFSCTPERIRRELICKGCKFIRCISPPPPPPPPPPQPEKKPKPDPSSRCCNVPAPPCCTPAKPCPTPAPPCCTPAKPCPTPAPPCCTPPPPCPIMPPYWYPAGGPCYYCYRVDCVCVWREECRGGCSIS